MNRVLTGIRALEMERTKVATAQTRRWRFTSLLLLLVGAACAAYLLTRSFAALDGKPSGSVDLCVVVFGTSCDAATQSEQSWIGGIPPAGWGVVFYATLAAFLILGWTLGDAFAYEASLAAMTLSLLGVSIGVGLTVAVSIGRGTSICPLCLMIHVTNCGLVFAFKKLSGARLRELGRSLYVSCRYVFGTDAEDPRAAAWKVVGLLNGALVAAVAYQWVYVETSLRRAAADKPRDRVEILAEYNSAPRLTIPFNGEDPHHGPLDAPVQLVIFSSFQCPACQQLARQLVPLATRFGSSLIIVFKQYPLGTACNPHVEFNQHPLSCDAAMMSAAAHNVGSFWKFHNALFAAQPLKSKQSIDQAAESVGLRAADLRQACQSESVTSRVDADIALGQRLGVDATPTLFLNGRRLTDLAPTTLITLVEYELAESR